jgi:hypothetical protein
VTPDRDHDAADLEPAALEPAPGEHVQEFLPPAEQVTAGDRYAPASLRARPTGDRSGCPVTVERAGTASRPGSGLLHAVPCHPVRRQG